MTARKTIMRRFRIDEISGVDSPCNEHARSVIFKRASPATEPGLESSQVPDGDHWRAKREAAGIVVRLLEEKFSREEVAAVDQKIAGLGMLSASVGGGGAGLSALASDFTGNFGEKGGLVLMADRYGIDRKLLRGVTESLLEFIEANGAPAAATPRRPRSRRRPAARRRRRGPPAPRRARRTKAPRR